MAENGVIGQHGKLPWRLKSEMAHFRSVTMGKPVVMGRKTYLSIGKPLSGRTNIVVSRDTDLRRPRRAGRAERRGGADAARGDALRRGAGEIAVDRRRRNLRETMAVADRLMITRVHLRPEGDTRFPVDRSSTLERSDSAPSIARATMTRRALRCSFIERRAGHARAGTG